MYNRLTRHNDASKHILYKLYIKLSTCMSPKTKAQNKSDTTEQRIQDVQYVVRATNGKCRENISNVANVNCDRIENGFNGIEVWSRHAESSSCRRRTPAARSHTIQNSLVVCLCLFFWCRRRGLCLAK